MQRIVQTTMVLAAALVAAGCYQPKLKNFGFACDPSAAKPCPDGYCCRSGFCDDGSGGSPPAAPAATAATRTWRCRRAAAAAAAAAAPAGGGGGGGGGSTSHDMAIERAGHGAGAAGHGQAGRHGRRHELRPRRVHDRHQAHDGLLRLRHRRSAQGLACCSSSTTSGTRSASAKSINTARPRPAPDFVVQKNDATMGLSLCRAHPVSARARTRRSRARRRPALRRRPPRLPSRPDLPPEKRALIVVNGARALGRRRRRRRRRLHARRPRRRLDALHLPGGHRRRRQPHGQPLPPGLSRPGQRHRRPRRPAARPRATTTTSSCTACRRRCRCCAPASSTRRRAQAALRRRRLRQAQARRTSIPPRDGKAEQKFAAKIAATAKKLEALREQRAGRVARRSWSQRDPKLAKDVAAVQRYSAQRGSFPEVEKRLVCEGILGRRAKPTKHVSRAVRRADARRRSSASSTSTCSTTRRRCGPTRWRRSARRCSRTTTRRWCAS